MVCSSRTAFCNEKMLFPFSHVTKPRASDQMIDCQTDCPILISVGTCLLMYKMCFISYLPKDFLVTYGLKKCHLNLLNLRWLKFKLFYTEWNKNKHLLLDK